MSSSRLWCAYIMSWEVSFYSLIIKVFQNIDIVLLCFPRFHWNLNLLNYFQHFFLDFISKGVNVVFKDLSVILGIFRQLLISCWSEMIPFYWQSVTVETGLSLETLSIVCQVRTATMKQYAFLCPACSDTLRAKMWVNSIALPLSFSALLSDCYHWLVTIFIIPSFSVAILLRFILVNTYYCTRGITPDYMLWIVLWCRQGPSSSIHVSKQWNRNPHRVIKYYEYRVEESFWRHSIS